MSPIRSLDLLNDPLEGTNLTEASAGTGKTYAITGLFLRLVVEKRLSVGKILVVTFTEAATQELRDRIRRTLRQALEAFSGEETEDIFLAELVEKHKSSRTARGDLTEALRAFDQAAIFTIHGFCQRVLRENAFESGSLFDTELIADQGDIIREIVCDFWRKHFCEASALFVHYTISRRGSPDSLFRLLGNRVALPYLKIIPRPDTLDTSLQERDFETCFHRVRDTWKSDRGQVEDILLNDESLSRVKFKKANIPGWMRSMDDCLATDGRNPLLFKGFEKFTKAELDRAVRKGHSPPTHRFFDLCNELKDKQTALMRAFDHRLLGLKVALFRFVQEELARRKGEKNIQSFDDLLSKLHQALQEKQGDALARAIRGKYKAALIDEFQDTDPIQYGIFKKVFGTEQSILFLIGDPKQAIYGFRSADVFTYMEAAESVATRYTLDKNWRSAPDLITAVNTLFAEAQNPFVYDKIGFQTAFAARKEDLEILRIDKKSGEPPFHLWLVDAKKLTGNDKPIPKSQARVLIADSVGGEISRLLHLGRDNRALLGDRPLSAGDIAVLVRRNAEARLIQEVLSGLNIPSVLFSTGNLFDSHEALEMERLLAGIVTPNNEGLLKTALATDMMGVKGEELDTLVRDEMRWEVWVVRLKAYHDLWQRRGFMQMFRRLLFDEEVMARLMLLPDGERRNTNVLHLSEVLHQASATRKLGMPGLVKWLAEQRDPDAPRLEEHQLRLESDERAVKLVTVHKSKGLEYPVVFCPFTWDGSRIKNAKEPFTFHDEANRMRLTLDMGSEEMHKNRACAENEALAENLRLLYVALTRARNLCYLVCGRFNQAETSAPAYLFHQPALWKGGDVARATAERFVGLNDGEMLDDLEAIVAKAGGAVKLSEMPARAARALPAYEVGERADLACRTFSGAIDKCWRISSFSSLVSHQQYSADLADRDLVVLPETYGEQTLEEPAADEASGFFAFPRGTKAGTVVHSIFENLDFAERDPSHVEQVVADQLSTYGYEPSWRSPTCHMIGKVLSFPLGGGREEFTLSHVANENRLTEFGFHFPLRFISAKELKNLLARHTGTCLQAGWPERIERLDFSPARGFMKGYIDVVFQFQNRYFLADWKTNFLGPSVEDYGKKSLDAAMSKGFYVLQYLIYTVALHQYLRLRLPGYAYEKHFGGVYYLFVRGMDPDKGTEFGVFKDKPSAALIDELCEKLIDVR
jgi:exodeoxyribonuclease V beta subunit